MNIGHYSLKKLNDLTGEDLTYLINYSNVENKILGNRPFNNEYLSHVSDILDHREFKKLREIRHHDSNVFNHVLRVSYLAYKICKRMGFNDREAARGALLHDFFLYDWKIKGERPYDRGFHGLKHARVALNNARIHFELSPVEEDIIVKHMWPLNARPPRYREALIVSFLDKYVASRELINLVRKSKRMKSKIA